MAKLTMVQALNLALDQEMAKDPSVVLLGEDIGPDGGVFRITDGLWKKYGDERVLDTPLAESGIVGSAIGMALAGLKPVAEMQFDGFAFLGLPQLEGNGSRFRSRTQGHYTCSMVLRFPYGAGVRALEHHSEAREASFAHLPGVKVVVPSGPRNARALMVASIRDPDPVVFMEPKRSYRAFREEVPDEEEVWPIGKAHVVQPGDHLTVISWGAMMPLTMKAVDHVAQTKKVSLEVLDLLTISPLDITAIITSVKKTGRCVIVQEGPRSFGVAAEIIARINDDALMYLQAPVKRVTGYDVVTPYFGRENYFFPTAETIQKGIEDTLAF